MPDNLRKQIAEVLLSSDRVVFLGFGYHEANMQKLAWREFLASAAVKCEGTWKGYSPNRAKLISANTNIELNEHGNCNVKEFLSMIEPLDW